MSLIDDLKTTLEKTSIKKEEITVVLAQISKMYGGSFPYVRKKESKKHKTQGAF